MNLFDARIHVRSHDEQYSWWEMHHACPRVGLQGDWAAVIVGCRHRIMIGRGLMPFGIEQMQKLRNAFSIYFIYGVGCSLWAAASSEIGFWWFLICWAICRMQEVISSKTLPDVLEKYLWGGWPYILLREEIYQWNKSKTSWIEFITAASTNQ